MKVVSIDPAPSKPAVIFDGQQFDTVSPSKLAAYCASLATRLDALLCWDAPLTGPASSHGSFSQRTIEQFFSRRETGFKAPTGISVLPYSGCPHWAITRACLGLPICGDYEIDKGRLPFLLTTDASEIKPGRARVVETHPAVAIWLWCRDLEDDNDGQRPWVYKGRKPSRTIEELWTSLTGIWRGIENHVVNDVIARIDRPTNDDELDAFVGWVLGTLLASGHKSVDILGDSCTGAIALPVTDELRKQFDTFTKQNAT